MGLETATLISLGSLAAGATGAVMSSMAASQQAKDQQAIADYNARVEEQQAKQIELKASYDQMRQAEEARRKMGSLTAGLGASGAVTSVGTPLLIQAKQASELELENLMIGYEGQVGAGAARNQAILDRLQGTMYGKKAKNAATAGYINAGSTLLTGFNKMGTFSGLGTKSAGTSTIAQSAMNYWNPLG